MHNWQAMRKKLEQDYLAPCLRGRIRYFATTYRDSHDREGRAAILLDGVEILRGGWFNLEPKWPHPWDPYEQVDETALEFGAFDQRSFYEAFQIFDNQSIEESLSCDNLLARIFALLVRRVGKRRLKAMAADMRHAPEVVRRFYEIRMQAEGLDEKGESGQAMEIWDLYDREGNPTGRTASRGRPLPEGCYHIVSSVLLRHADGSYLVMRRDPEKPIYPGWWEASAGGAAQMGEDALACAKRELFEETGIVGENFRLVAATVSDEKQNLRRCFTAGTDCDKTAVTLQAGETVDFRWISGEELRREIVSGEVLSTAMTGWFVDKREQGTGNGEQE